MTPTLHMTFNRRWYGSAEDGFRLAVIALANDRPVFTQRELDGLAFMRSQATALEWQEHNLS